MTEKTFIMVPAVYLAELVELKGTHVAAAEALGLSPSAVSKYLKDGTTRLAIELASRALVNEATTHKDTILVVRASAEQLKVLMPVLEALRIPVKEL